MFIFNKIKSESQVSSLTLFLKRKYQFSLIPFTYGHIKLFVPTKLKNLLTNNKNIDNDWEHVSLIDHTYNLDYCRNFSYNEISCYFTETKYSNYFKVGFKLFSFGLMLDIWLDKG